MRSVFCFIVCTFYETKKEPPFPHRKQLLVTIKPSHYVVVMLASPCQTLTCKTPLCASHMDNIPLFPFTVNNFCVIMQIAFHFLSYFMHFYHNCTSCKNICLCHIFFHELHILFLIQKFILPEVERSCT